MSTYSVTLSSAKAKITNQAGTSVTAATDQDAQKLANQQAALLSHKNTNNAWDWKATIVKTS